jgi:GcrA cell cycle regulator
MTFSWTHAAVRDLKAWWPDHSLSCSHIADRLGTTKNAVIGKARRLSLPYRLPERAGRGRLPSDEPPRALFKSHAPIKPWKQSPRGPKRLTHWDDLTFRSCRFIPGDPDGAQTLFCGDPTVTGKSYCPHHLALCWGRGTPSERAVA